MVTQLHTVAQPLSLGWAWRYSIVRGKKPREHPCHADQVERPYVLGRGAKCGAGRTHLLANRNDSLANRSFLEQKHRPAVFKAVLVSLLTACILTEW
ncbi:hypothetical protein D3C72_2041440 [compost metagenome]